MVAQPTKFVVNLSFLCVIVTMAFCSLAITENEGYDIDFKWTVRNFLSYPAKFGDSIKSPDFGSTFAYVGARVEIVGELYPRGQTKEEIVAVYLYVRVLPSNSLIRAVASYEIGIVGRNGSKLRTGKVNKVDDGNLTLGFGFHQFVSLKEMETRHEEYLPNGHLTLKFSGKAYFRFVTNVSKVYEPAFARETLTKMFKDEIGADIIVKVRDSSKRQFKCHKSVLSVRSPYLKTLIELKPEEHELDLSDQMSGDELGDLMEYVYLGTTSNLNKTGKTLFKLADIYGFPELRDLGEMALVDQLDEENAWDMMLFAHQFGAKKLKKEAASIVAKSVD